MFYFIYLGTLFENFNEAFLFDKNKCSEHELFLFNYLLNLKEILMVIYSENKREREA